MGGWMNNDLRVAWGHALYIQNIHKNITRRMITTDWEEIY